MGFIQEAMHDFYKEQTFFASARKYPAELKKQIMSFLQGKKITSMGGRWNKPLDLANLGGMDKTDKKKGFLKILSNIEIGSAFFQAKNDYYAKIQLPTILYNDLNIEINISSNEDFFDTGHDLKISVNKEGEQYGSKRDKREFSYKINIMQPVPKVLDLIWEKIEEAVKNYSTTEKPESTYNSNKRHPKSDVQRTVNTILNSYYKTYKSGKKVKIDDYEKMPAYFRVSQDDSVKNRTLNKRNDGFKLIIEIRKLKSSTVSGSSRYSSEINPIVLEKYPDIKEWIKIYNEADKEMSGKSYGRFSNTTNFIGDKIYSDDHAKAFKKLEFVAKKFAKMGYIPDSSRSEYGSGHSKQNAYIHFKYNEAFKKAIDGNESYLNKVTNGPKFRGHLKKAFYSKGKVIEDLPRNMIELVFNNLKKST